ncbi:guanylate cyclase 32E-like [Glandiceps talaboti]
MANTRIAPHTSITLFILIFFSSQNPTRGEEFRTLLSYPLGRALFSPLSAEQSFGAGLLIGFETVNNDPTLLPGHILTYDRLETRCSKLVLGPLSDMVYTTNYSALIGPVCSEEALSVAVLAEYRNLPYMCAGCSKSQFQFKFFTGYGTLLRTLGSFDEVGPALTTGLFNHFNWLKFGVIVETIESVWFPVAQAINTTVIDSDNLTLTRYKSYYKDRVTDEDMLEIMTEMAAWSRI